MNHASFHTFLDDTLSALRQLTDTKGVEYAHDADQLANFRRLAERLGMTPEAVVLVYLTKHLDAIEGYIRGLSSGQSEPIIGRVDDALLYLVLLRALICENPGAVSVEQRRIATRNRANGSSPVRSLAGQASA